MNAAQRQKQIANLLSLKNLQPRDEKSFAVKCAMAAEKILQERPDIASAVYNSPFSYCDMMVAYYYLTIFTMNPTVQLGTGKTVLVASAIFEDERHLKEALRLAKDEVTKAGLNPAADDRHNPYNFGQIGDIILDPNPRHDAILGAFCKYARKLQEELGEGDYRRILAGELDSVRPSGCGCLIMLGFFATMPLFYFTAKILV